MAESRSRKWCFTFNNYTEQEESTLKESLQDDSKYCIIGKEEGKETHTKHLQGFVVFKSDKRLSTLKNQYDKKIHWEECKGTVQQNIDYCSKDGNFSEFGEAPKGKGSRSDLEELHLHLLSGASVKDISNAHFGTFLRYNKGIMMYKLYNQPKNKDTKPEVIVLIGKTGTGKTKYANEQDENAYWKACSNKWWDGYDGEETIILDEMKHSKDSLTIEDLLRLTDRYHKTGEIKGGTIGLYPKKIIITSNYQPWEWYPFAPEESIHALFRRFTTYINTDTQPWTIAKNIDGKGIPLPSGWNSINLH